MNDNAETGVYIECDYFDVPTEDAAEYPDEDAAGLDKLIRKLVYELKLAEYL